MGGKCNGATSNTATMGATNAASSASAATVGTADWSATDDVATTDADDGTTATNAARGAIWHDVSPIGKHDDATATVRRVKSVRTDLLTGRGGF